MARPRFHLAFPVDDLAAARRFYGELMGCPEGRSSESWVDFDLFGHQIVAHLAPEECSAVKAGAVDGKQVPVRHFGLLLDWSDWEALAETFEQAGTEFIIEPYIRFKGEAGEQGTFFVRDPAGNALEFKTFRDEAQIFAR
ncbi:VOC family protein [Maricaulis parjimensis]|uniref:VOC family protein n=1 Tax=Maricaulis parjimensis TaxID=144023 RepID=UPI00193A00C0|nr:VOC family protein [Maricaulis parjimensis]